MAWTGMKKMGGEAVDDDPAATFGSLQFRSFQLS